MEELIDITPLVFTCWWILIGQLNIYIKKQAFFIDRYWIPKGVVFLFCYDDNQNKTNEDLKNKRRMSSSSVSPSMTIDAVRLVCEDDTVLDLISFFLTTTIVRTWESNEKVQ
jgi:hypothetical protein